MDDRRLTAAGGMEVARHEPRCQSGFETIAPREDGKTIVCGHTSQKSGLPKCKDHAICIDTNACRGGWLTCLDVQTGVYYQANQEQETRQGWLDELD